MRAQRGTSQTSARLIATRKKMSIRSAEVSASLWRVGRSLSADHRQKDGTWNVHNTTWPGVYSYADSGVARALQCVVGPQSLIDLGAGAGSYGAWLEGCDASVRPQWNGFEGNPEVESFTSRQNAPEGAFTRHLNLCNATVDAAPPLHDWAMSLEVGEHLPSKCIPKYLALLNATARHGIVLSWGTDRYGRGHINPRSIGNVTRMLAAVGFTLHKGASSWMRAASGLPWFRAHLSVYLRNATRAAAAIALDGGGSSWEDVPIQERYQCPGDQAMALHKAWRERLARSFSLQNCSVMQRLLPCDCDRGSTGKHPSRAGFGLTQADLLHSKQGLDSMPLPTSTGPHALRASISGRSRLKT